MKIESDWNPFARRGWWKKVVNDPERLLRYWEIEEWDRRVHAEAKANNSPGIDAAPWMAMIREFPDEPRQWPHAIWYDFRRVFEGRGRLRSLREFFFRGKHGWAPSDTWSLDCYLAQVLSESLQHLAENSHGWPGEQSPWPTYEEWIATIKHHAEVLARYYKNKLDVGDLGKEWFKNSEAEELAVQETMRELGKMWRYLGD